MIMAQYVKYLYIHTAVFLSAAHGGGSHLLLAIMAALRPLRKPKIVREPSSSGTRQAHMSKLSTAGGNPEALTIGCTEDARARS